MARGDKPPVKSAAQVKGRLEPFSIWIPGEPASKANSRRIVRIGKRTAVIKSAKALNYADDFAKHCPVLDPMFLCDVHMDIHIDYASRRPDLDESLILDLLQNRVYLNDRQVRSRRTTWGLSKASPGTSLHVRPLEGSDSPGNS